jgi:hypothetical protein
LYGKILFFKTTSACTHVFFTILKTSIKKVKTAKL